MVLTMDTLNLAGCFVMGFFNLIIFHQTLVTAGVFGKQQTENSEVAGAE